MSRVSIGRRLDRLFTHWRPRGSMAERLERLTDEQRTVYEKWLRQHHEILAADGDDGAFRTYRDEPWTPKLRSDVELTMFPELNAVRAAPDAYQAYRLMTDDWGDG